MMFLRSATIHVIRWVCLSTAPWTCCVVVARVEIVAADDAVVVDRQLECHLARFLAAGDRFEHAQRQPLRVGLIHGSNLWIALRGWLLAGYVGLFAGLCQVDGRLVVVGRSGDRLAVEIDVVVDVRDVVAVVVSDRAQATPNQVLIAGQVQAVQYPAANPRAHQALG